MKGIGGAIAGGAKKIDKAIPGGIKGGAQRVLTGDPTVGKTRKAAVAKPTASSSSITATGGQDISTAGMGKDMPESIMAKPTLPPPPGAPPSGGGFKERLKGVVKSAGKSSGKPKEELPPPPGGKISRYDPNWRTFGSKGK